MSYRPVEKEIFHVHTFRCGHASCESDKKYVKAAVRLGASRIVFTDHTPFPGDAFANRMYYRELNEYVSSVKKLKEIYSGKIEILCGLEAEYLPDYHDYYEKLKVSGDFDLLIIGQHFFQHSPGCYSLHDKDKTYEYEGQCTAMEQGIRTGLFDVVAHPDRSFRLNKKFGDRERASAEKVIRAADETGIYLEKNLSSLYFYDLYRTDFWDMVPDNVNILTGYDAHSTSDMKTEWKRYYSEK